MLAPPATGCILEQFDAPGTLIMGIGNVAREDDGLGWALLDAIEAGGWCRRARLHRAYQLELQDADLIAGAQRVLIVDSTTDLAVTSYAWLDVTPALDASFTSHALSVPAVLATATMCFDRVPPVDVLALRGHSFTLTMGLTDAATAHLTDAMAHLTSEGSR